MWSLLLNAAASLVLANASPVCPIEAETVYERMERLLFQSEDLRLMHDEWRHFWMHDQPSHLKVERVHGGIGP